MSERGGDRAAADALVDRMALLADAVERDPAFDVEAFLADDPSSAPLLRAGLAGLVQSGLVGPPPPEPLARAALAPDERYEIHGRIAQGGMGEVWRALDRELGRVVALKTIRSDLPELERARAGRLLVARFLNEARVNALLEHPGIVPVYDLGVRGGRPFFTMKLVEGKPLSRWAADQPPGAALDAAITILERVCEAVEFAHARGFVHRDLKPANVMVGEYGEIYVLDWGLATRVGDGERAAPSASDVGAGDDDSRARERARREDFSSHRDRIGTTEYMAPEQARGDAAAIGVRTDVFGLGAILHHLLHRRAPYEHADPDAALDAARRAAPFPPPRAASAPRELRAVCARSMAADPAERYASARELAADLRAARRGERGTAWRDSLAARFVKTVRRRPATSAVGLAALVLACVATAGAAWLHALEAERGDLARREREASLSRELRRLAGIAATPLDAREDRGRDAEYVSAILRTLDGWGIALQRGVPAEVLAARVRAHPPSVRADLLDALFLLAQHAGRAQLARSGATTDADAATADPWREIVAVVEAAAPLGAGAQALRAYADWLDDPARAPVQLEREPAADASPGEVCFWALVVECFEGRAAAAAALDRILAERPDLAACHLRRGMLALRARAWDVAIAHGTAALALWPESNVARDVLGLAFEGRGDATAARAQYLAALAHDPADLASRFRLTCVIREKGGASDLEAEIEVLDRAHRLAPPIPEILGSAAPTAPGPTLGPLLPAGAPPP